MNAPDKLDLPFFAYGLFRPGQLAFFQVRDLLGSVVEPVIMNGTLLLRDGLPILDSSGHGHVVGAVLTFSTNRTMEAYDRISAMEPDNHYRWEEAQVDGKAVNVLVGRYPKKGSVYCEDEEWNGWRDPLFTSALDVVEETLGSQEFEWNLKPLFRLQMAYLLLWSAIERYVSLRYGLSNNIMEKIGKLANEPAFATSLRHHVKEERNVFRADSPSKKKSLNANSPQCSVDYYYQVRCNITHRGKAAVRDYELLKQSLTELLPIFRDVLRAAENDALYSV